ncbi:MAG: manganese efflux pump MntP family protein, partial [Candidatus Flemingiibacterium sp.]
MDWSFIFFLNSILLGAGLAMDAFSVSLANGLGDPHMKKTRMCGIAGVFAGFQFAMPMIGWICVHTIVQYFKSFEKFIPWIALVLLGYIGGSMLVEGIRGGDESAPGRKLTLSVLLVQGVATSI